MLVRNFPVCNTYFDDFTFTGFVTDSTGAVRGNLQARRKSDSLLVQIPIAITDSLTTIRKPELLFSVIDNYFVEALHMLQTFVPHTPGELCRNNFCEECYR